MFVFCIMVYCLLRKPKMEGPIPAKRIQNIPSPLFWLYLSIKSVHLESRGRRSLYINQIPDIAPALVQRDNSIRNVIADSVDPIVDHRLAMAAHLQLLEDLAADQDRNIQETSFNLVNLFEEWYGGEGFLNLLCHCRTCYAYVIRGEQCEECGDRKYISTVCNCTWDGDDVPHFCRLCAENGYMPYIMQGDADLPTEPIVAAPRIRELYCYLAIYPGTGFYRTPRDHGGDMIVCEECWRDMNGPQLPTVQPAERLHLTRTRQLQTRCSICRNDILRSLNPQHCHECNVNRVTGKNTLQSFGEVAETISVPARPFPL